MKRLTVVISLALLSACVSTESQMPAESAEAPAVNRQRMIDTGYCRQEAEAAAPMPRAVALGAPAGYSVSGSYNQPGYLPSTFRANVEPQGTMMDAFQRGQMYADANEDRYQAQRARNEIYAGCMAARGW
ncbi:MAG TPA: hypothetical protein PLI43_02470 [Albidovulum sp.]|uniref:hypothetical protein n=1 Tax=Albidovulum sp. TaxID=1872424 RepID=UPI002B9D56D0|nr:hypothetical protein [Albidovulum sp.]